MAEGVRLVSVRRGVDPRRFALFAFGGAAGLHATDIARQLGLARVVVPRVAAVLSAWGMLATDLRFEVSRTHIGDAGALDGAAVKRLFDDMEAEACAGCVRLSVGRRGPRGRSTCATASRCFEVTVPLDDVDWTAPTRCRRSSSGFTAGTRRSTPIRCPTRKACWSNARVTVSGILEELPQEPDLPTAAPVAAAGERRIFFDDWVAAPVYRFDALVPGQRIAGPRDRRIGDNDGAAAPRRYGKRHPRGWLDIAVPAGKRRSLPVRQELGAMALEPGARAVAVGGHRPHQIPEARP